MRDDIIRRKIQHQDEQLSLKDQTIAGLKEIIADIHNQFQTRAPVQYVEFKQSRSSKQPEDL